MTADWIKRAPVGLLITVVIVLGASTLGYLGGYVWLTAQGVDTTEYRGLLNSTLNWLAIIFGGGTFVASVSAARSSNQAADQTNGHLAERDAEIISLRRELARRDGS